eukprot:GEMP01030807.1.p1 GENE.GEMP01030807.1~~GEMP01030807.1.p1  ORF type:complete len:580 (+),score=116.64 GEMP01030807.1:39-1778(+)
MEYEYMNGSFENVTIAIRPIEKDGSEWILNARYVTYDMEAADVVVLRIVAPSRAVKVECDEDVVADSSTPAFGADAPQASPFALSSTDARPDTDKYTTTANQEPEDTPMSSSPQHAPVAQKTLTKMHTRCNVDTCVRFSQRCVAQPDAYGPSGRRCMRHGGRPLRRDSGIPVASRLKLSAHCRTTDDSSSTEIAAGRPCTSVPRFPSKVVKKVQLDKQNTSDRASRIERKRHLRCNVDACTRFSRRNIAQPDAYGPSGRRCARHGGHPLRRDSRIPVASRPKVSAHRRATDDSSPRTDIVAMQYCAPGPRSPSKVVKKVQLDKENTSDCANSMTKGSRCNVDNCRRFSQRTVEGVDSYGLGGPRCAKHGGIKMRTLCNVETCMGFYRRNIAQPDAYGPSGPRCFRHGGRPLRHDVRIPAAPRTEVSDAHRRTTDESLPTTDIVATRRRAIFPRFTSKVLIKGTRDKTLTRRATNRSMAHTQCNVDACTRFSRRIVSDVDVYGHGGPRCFRHGGRKSSVQGKVDGGNDNAAAKNRRRAPRRRSPFSVVGCTRVSRWKMVNPNTFGPSEHRCPSHGECGSM